MPIVSTANSPRYEWGEGCEGWHLLAHPDLHVIQERVPAGRGERRHFHTHARQFFFLLAGRAVIELAGCEHSLGAGEGLEIPPGLPHVFRNLSEDVVDFLVISHPTTRGDRQDLP